MFNRAERVLRSLIHAPADTVRFLGGFMARFPTGSLRKSDNISGLVYQAVDRMTPDRRLRRPAPPNGRVSLARGRRTRGADDVRLRFLHTSMYTVRIRRAPETRGPANHCLPVVGG